MKENALIKPYESQCHKMIAELLKLGYLPIKWDCCPECKGWIICIDEEFKAKDKA